MNLKEIEKVVGSIQSNLFKNSNAFSVGMLKSHFRGAGLQFKEHQIYNPGDDVRFIDWKLSAKTNTTFVKTFEEERNVEIHILLDINETMHMGYKGVSKLQAAIEIICLIFLLAEKSKDKVSIIVNCNELIIIPVSSGQKGIIQLISLLEKNNIIDSNGHVNYSYEFQHKSNSNKVMGMLKSLVARGKEVILLSDLNNFENEDILSKLLYRKNMHCFILQSSLDRMEKMPFSIFGRSNREIRYIEKNSSLKKELPKGRYKYLEVSDRYLEKFIREML